MTVAQQKIIHRFIKPISAYEQGGDQYYRVIPLDTQAYAIYPTGLREVDMYYVFGDGKHTYLEIKNGMGETAASREYPVISVKDIEGFMRKSDEPNTLYAVNENGETVMLPQSVFVRITEEANKIYGTDQDGKQTTYDFETFGKVDDVRVNSVSVVTDKIANLNSMALEDKEDYLLKTRDEERVYGTDKNGEQTTYDVNDFGKIDDVRVDGTSIVTNKIVDLGTMSLEDKNTYLEKTNEKNSLYGTDNEGDQKIIPIGDIASVKLLLTNIQVLSSSWEERTTTNGDKSEFPYQSVIEDERITDDMIPEVNFTEKESAAGLLSPVCLAIKNKLYIYSREVIDYDFVIPTIIFLVGPLTTGYIEETKSIKL